MQPSEALAFLFAASNAAPLNKDGHLKCEQAKASLEVALHRLAELSSSKKGDGDRKPRKGK